MEFLICSSCKSELVASHFYRGQTNCKTCMKARAYQWRANNPERYKQLTSGWRKARKEKVLTDQRIYRQRPERKLAQRINNLNRKARKKNAPGHYKPADIRALMVTQGGLCALCQCNLSASGFHIDHKQALVNGGSNWPENLQLLCPPCNLSKGSS